MVHRLVRHAAGDRAVADDGHAVVLAPLPAGARSRAALALPCRRPRCTRRLHTANTAECSRGTTPQLLQVPSKTHSIAHPRAGADNTSRLWRLLHSAASARLVSGEGRCGLPRVSTTRLAARTDLEVARDRHAQRGGHRRGRVPRAEGVVLALRAVREACARRASSALQLSSKRRCHNQRTHPLQARHCSWCPCIYNSHVRPQERRLV